MGSSANRTLICGGADKDSNSSYDIIESAEDSDDNQFFGCMHVGSDGHCGICGVHDGVGQHRDALGVNLQQQQVKRGERVV